MAKSKVFDGVIDFHDKLTGEDYELRFNYTLNVLNETLDLEYWEAHRYMEDKECLIEDEALSHEMELAIEEHLEKEACDIDWNEEKYLAGADE